MKTATFKRLYAEAIQAGVPYVVFRTDILAKEPLTENELQVIEDIGAQYELEAEGMTVITFDIDRALAYVEDEDVLDVLKRFQQIYKADQEIERNKFKTYMANQKKGQELQVSFWSKPRNHARLAVTEGKGVNSYLVDIDNLINELEGKARVVTYNRYLEPTNIVIEDTPESRAKMMEVCKFDDKLNSFIINVVMEA